MAGFNLPKPKAAKGAAAIMSYGRQASRQGGIIGGAGVANAPKTTGRAPSGGSGPKTMKAPKRKK